MSFWSGVLVTGVSLTVPILLAAIGELVSERGGVLNIGLEGMMAAGAFAGFVVMLKTGSPWLSGLVAMLAGCVVASLMAGASVYGRANQIVVGFALFLMAPGIVDFLYAQNVDSLTATSALGTLEIPGLSAIPLVGEALFEQNGYWYASVVIILITLFMLNRTRLGLEITAVGNSPETAIMKGINVKRVRTYATLTAGALAGLGGSALTVGVLGAYSAGVVSGRGFVAIAVVILGRWRVGWVVVAAAAIGIADALQLRLGEKVDVPIQLLGLLPWLIVLIMLILGARFSVMPKSLGRAAE